MTLFVAMSPTGLENEPPSATTRTTMSRSVTTASTCPSSTTGTAPVSSSCITTAAARTVSFGDTVRGFGVITSRIFIDNIPPNGLYAKQRPELGRQDAQETVRGVRAVVSAFRADRAYGLPFCPP